MMKIALIGARGQLGTDLQKVIPQDNLINLNYPDFDITQQTAISRQLTALHPDIVINTAAYNLVDRAEQYPDEAMAVNYHGVENLVDYCQKNDLPLVHFSTDYVFGADKNRHRPYTEQDKPCPINKYGQSKLLGEQIIQKNLKKYFLIRTSGLIGTAGSEGKGGNFIEAIIKKAKKDKQLKIVDDQILTPTYTLDLAKQVWRVIQTDNYGLFHITSEGQCSWYEFAREVFKNLKQKIQIKAIKSDELNLPAQRPHYAVLENKRLKELGLNIMRPWQATIPDYLKEKSYL